MGAPLRQFGITLILLRKYDFAQQWDIRTAQLKMEDKLKSWRSKLGNWKRFNIFIRKLSFF